MSASFEGKRIFGFSPISLSRVHIPRLQTNPGKKLGSDRERSSNRIRLCDKRLPLGAPTLHFQTSRIRIKMSYKVGGLVAQWRTLVVWEGFSVSFPYSSSLVCQQWPNKSYQISAIAADCDKHSDDIECAVLAGDILFTGSDDGLIKVWVGLLIESCIKRGLTFYISFGWVLNVPAQSQGHLIYKHMIWCWNNTSYHITSHHIISYHIISQSETSCIGLEHWSGAGAVLAGPRVSVDNIKLFLFLTMHQEHTISESGVFCLVQIYGVRSGCGPDSICILYFCRYVVYDLAVDPTGQTLFSCSMDGIYR